MQTWFICIICSWVKIINLLHNWQPTQTLPHSPLPALHLFALNIYFIVWRESHWPLSHRSHAGRAHSWWPRQAVTPPRSLRADRVVQSPPTWMSHTESQAERDNRWRSINHSYFVCMCRSKLYLSSSYNILISKLNWRRFKAKILYILCLLKNSASHGESMFKVLNVSLRSGSVSTWPYNRHLVGVPGNSPDHQWQPRHRGLCHGHGSSCGWPQLAGPGWPKGQSQSQ